MMAHFPTANRGEIACRFIRTLLMALLASVSFTAATAETLTPGSITVAGTERSYTIWVHPACARARAACPLLLSFHGGGLRGVSGRQFEESGGFVAAAARRHVVMVFPDAIGSNWNDGRPGIGGGVDDVGFVRALIARVRADVPGIDPARTYATGMSNGGHMSFRLACEMPEVITAIAPVAATLSAALSERCAPAQPVPVLNILGERDPISPYAGGHIRGRRGAVTSAAQTLAFWQRTNRCTGDVVQTRVGPLTTRRFDRCGARVSVVQHSLADGGHTWPGYPVSRFMTRLVGPTSMALNATTATFDFFGIPQQGKSR